MSRSNADNEKFNLMNLTMSLQISSAGSKIWLAIPFSVHIPYMGKSPCPLRLGGSNTNTPIGVYNQTERNA